MVHLASFVALINPQDKVHSTQSLINDKRSNVNLINCPRTIKPMEEGEGSLNKNVQSGPEIYVQHNYA
jgi:hypothetical protein